MRRAILLLAVFLVVGALAFAEGPVATFGADAYNGIAIASPSTGTTVAAYDYSWVGAGGMDAKFQYTSADGNAGLRVRMRTTPEGSATVGVANLNQFNAFGKFFNGMVTVRAGVLDDYTTATGVWNCYGNTDGAVGLYAAVAPVAGLTVGYFQPIPAAAKDVAKLIDGAKAGVAYSMSGIGSVVAGAVLTSATYGMQIYFGGSVSAVKDLSLSFEGAYTTASANSPIDFLLNAGYSMGALSVGSYVGVHSAGSELDWGLEPTVSYKVTDNLTVNAIVNLYGLSSTTGNKLVWMSPIDAGAIAGGVESFNFGGGVSVNYAASGATITIGDFFSGATAGGNVVYVGMEFAL